MTLGRASARRFGFVLVVIAGIGFELSPWGARVAGVVLDLQLAVLAQWNPHLAAGDSAVSRLDEGTAARGEALRPLSRTMAVTLIVVCALVWWESRLLGWAIASSLVALAALLAVSTMMLPRGVLVPTAGPGLAIVAGMLGRRVLETVIASRARGRPAAGPPPTETRPGE